MDTTDKFIMIAFVVSVAFMTSFLFLPGSDKLACYQSVKDMYPNAEVQFMPDRPYTFLVRKEDKSILLVSTHNFFDANVSSSIEIFKGEGL